MGRNSCCVKQKLRKGLWSPEEDEKLYNYITRFGVGCWSSVPKLAGLQRCGKSCRLRWINYLRPDLKRGMFSQQEEDLIINLHEALGNRWAQIAAQLPGRTDNEIKNFWNSSLKKKLLKQGVDPNTHKPIATNMNMIKDEVQTSGSETYNPAKMAAGKQVFDPLFLSEFQANVDIIPHGFQPTFLNPIHGFTSLPDLTNFDHPNLETHSSSRFMAKDASNLGFHQSGMMMQINNNNTTFSWEDEGKLDSVFQFQFSGIQIEERSDEKLQNHDDFGAYPLNMSVFDHHHRI